jgi:hypothetical protein
MLSLFCSRKKTGRGKSRTISVFPRPKETRLEGREI